MKTYKAILIVFFNFLLLTSCLNKEASKHANKEIAQQNDKNNTNCREPFNRSEPDENLMLNINLKDHLNFQPFHLDLINSFAILGKFEAKSNDSVNIDFRLKERYGCDQLKITNIELTKFNSGENPCNLQNGTKKYHITIFIEKLDDNESKQDYTGFNSDFIFSNNDIIDIHIKSSIQGLGSISIPTSCSDASSPDLGNGACRGGIKTNI